MEQELLTFPFSSGVHVVKSLCEVFCRLLVVLVSLKNFILAIALSVLPWFMTSNYPFSIFNFFLISSKNCGSFCVSVSLPSSTSLELWSTQTDYQVQQLHNYGAHKLITKFNIIRTMEHKLITKFIIFRTMEHKLITKFNIVRTMEHTN